MADELSIKIQAILDKQKSIRNIEDQLAEISKEVNISFNVDSQQLNRAKEIIERNLKSKPIEIINAEQVKEKGIEIAKSLEEVKKKYEKIGEVNFTGKAFDPITRDLTKFTANVKEGDGLVKKLTFDLAKLNESGKISDVFQLKGIKENDNRTKIAEQTLQKRHQINQQIEKDTQKQEEQQKKAASDYEQWWLKALKERELKEESLKQKIAEQNKRLTQQLELYKREAQIKTENLTRRFGEHVNDRKISTYLRNVKALTVATPELQYQMKKLNTSFKEISAEATTSGSHVMGFMERFKTALTMIPAWLGSTTIIFGALRGLKSIVTTIEMVNQKMTELKRVMPNNTNFNGMLQDSIKLSSQLGRKLSDVLDIQNAFARQGYNQGQIHHLTKVAALLQNISDLKPQEALDAIISGMKNFNISAKDSIKIANELNQVDNMYSVTTQQLGTSLFKAASTAKVYGVTMAQLIGQTTAIAEVTRESGNVVGNSLKTLYSRLETSSKSIKLLNQIGITVKKSNGEMKSATEVLTELYHKWNHLSSARKQALGVAIAGRRQLSRFFALMNNYGDAIKATNTALHAQGSATMENAKYQQSLEAKINKLDTAWQGLAINIGKNGLTGAFSGVINGLTDIAKGSTNVIKEFGLLPPVIAAATTALLLFNHESTRTNGMLLTKSIKGLITSFRNMDEAFAASSLKTGMFGAASLVASKSVRGLKLAMTSIGEFAMGAILPVAAITALSFGVEKLISHFQKLHQEQVKFKKESDKMLSDYTTNQDKLNQKLKEYYELESKKASSSLSSKENKEYLAVQNSINQLMPSLTSKVDKNGNAHLKTADAIKTEIKYVKELQKNQEKLSAVTYEKNAEKIANNIKNLFSKLSNAHNNASQSYFKTGSSLFDQLVHPPKWFQSFFEGTNRKLMPKSPEQQVKDQTQLIYAQHQLALAIQQTQQKAQSQVSSFLSVDKATKQLTDSDHKLINSFIQTKTAAISQKQWKTDAKRQYEQLVNSATAYGKALANLRTLLGSGANLSFVKGLSSNQLSGLMGLIDDFKAGNIPVNKFAVDLKHLGLSAKQVNAVLKDLSHTQKNNTQDTKSESAAQKTFQQILKGTANVAEIVAKAKLGYDQQDINKTTQLIQVYNALSQATNLNAQQKYLLKQVTKQLIKLFPALFKGHKEGTALTKDQIVAVENEVNAQAVLYKATIEAANGQLNAQQQATLGRIKGTNKRISEMQKEIQALEILNKALGEQMKIARQAESIGNRSMTIQAGKFIRRDRQELAGLPSTNLNALKSQLSHLKSSYYTGISHLAKSINFQPTFRTPDFSSAFPKPKTPKPKKGSKSTAQQQKINKYQTDKFAQALAKLDVELQKSKDRMDDYNKTSKAYRDELDKQISILKQKREVTKNEINHIKNQTDSLKRQLSAMGSYNHLSNKQKQTYNQIAQQIDQNINKVNNLETSYADLGQQIQDTQNQIKDIYNNLADSIIQIYKNAYEQMKQIALDANQKELDSLKNAHDKRIQYLDDVMNKYQDMINQKLKAIDKQENQDQYEQQLTEKKKKRQETLNQINRLSMDNSLSAQKKVHDLKQQLAQQEMDIHNFVHQHNIKLRKQNLQDQLSAKQKEIDASKKAENTKFQQQQNELQKERDAINKHWENVINDERHWTKIRNDILSGHFKDIQKDLKTFTQTLKNHMGELGSSITNNLIDKIKEAQKELRQLSNMPAPKAPSSHHATHHKQPSHHETHHESSSHSSNNGRGKGRWYTVKPGDTYSEIAQRFYGSAYPEWHKIADANHFKPRDIPIGARIWIPFKSGGYTGDWSGSDGRAALLHQKELVLNQSDTKNLLDSVKILRNMFGSQNLNVPNVGGHSNQTTVNMNINIDKMNGTQQGVKDFFGTISDQMHRRGVNLNWS